MARARAFHTIHKGMILKKEELGRRMTESNMTRLRPARIHPQERTGGKWRGEKERNEGRARSRHVAKTAPGPRGHLLFPLWGTFVLLGLKH